MKVAKEEKKLAKDTFGSGNGLVPPGSKPLPESMLIQIFVTLFDV